MNIAAKVPNAMLDSFNGFNKFVNNRIAPSLSWSGGVISSITDLFQAAPGSADSGSMSLAEKYNSTEEIGQQIEKLRTRYYFDEDTTAGNEDAKLCLKKEGNGNLGICDDYSESVQSLARQEQDRKQANPSLPKLKVDVYFAESDIMIGKTGQEYFDQCWQDNEVPNIIEYESMELPGTNHDSTVLDLKKGALEHIFDKVKKASQY